jgi:hypothetical protein
MELERLKISCAIVAISFAKKSDAVDAIATIFS